MGWLKNIFREIFGLFVDDGSFALAILVWLCFMWLALPRLALPPSWKGVILFAGLASILFENTRRYSRKSSQAAPGQSRGNL